MIDFEGKYINGIRIGKEYYNNGELKFEGDRNGKGIEYYYKSSQNQNLEILFEGNFRNNYRWNGKGKEIEIIEGNGKGFEFDKYGKLQFEGEYKDGKKWKGKEFYEDEKNKIKFEGEYKDGKKWKGKVYNKLGNLIFDGEYKKIYYYNKLLKKQFYFERQRYKSIEDINNWKDGIIFDNENNKGNGFGKEYENNNLIFEGVFKDYKRLKGREYNSYDKNLIFEGEYKNNLRWKGKIFKNFYEFDGEIRNGNKKFYIYIPL